ncbi:YncE family protein [Nocardia sp. NPDC057668]|uniref:YncE family protein n=1 Tax=Nocardia sp. NPDC057668 TaxID=3346202 RepID=UPI00366B4E45
MAVFLVTAALVIGAERTGTPQYTDPAGRLFADFGIPVRNRPVSLAVYSNTAYVIGKDGTLVMVDTAAGATLATITLGSAPGEAVLNPDSKLLYVTNGDRANKNWVDVVDTATRTVKQSITVGAKATDIAIDQSVDSVYVVGEGSGSGISLLEVIDIRTNSVVAELPIRGSVFDLAVDPSTHLVYASVRREGGGHGEGTVVVIDGPKRSITATLPLPGNAYRLAVDPEAHTLFVEGEVDSEDGPTVFHVIDTRTRAVTGEIAVDGSVAGIAVDPLARVFYTFGHSTPAGSQTRVSMIRAYDTDARAASAEAVVRSGMPLGGNGIAVDPATGRVFVIDEIKLYPLAR